MLKEAFGGVQTELTAALKELSDFILTPQSLTELNKRGEQKYVELPRENGVQYITGQLIENFENTMNIMDILEKIPSEDKVEDKKTIPSVLPVNDSRDVKMDESKLTASIMKNKLAQVMPLLEKIGILNIIPPEKDIRYIAKQMGADGLVEMRLYNTQPLTYMAIPVQKATQ